MPLSSMMPVDSLADCGMRSREKTAAPDECGRCGMGGAPRLPPAAVQMRRAVVEHELEHRTRAFAETLHAGRDDGAAHRGGLLEFQIADGEKFPAILVAARFVQQQVLDGKNLQPREQARTLLAHAPDRSHGRGERRNCIFRRRHRRTIQIAELNLNHRDFQAVDGMEVEPGKNHFSSTR